MSKPVDLVVVGGGAAGLVAAKTAAGLGATAVLVERDRPGGDCLWTGCVPSKALLAAARRAHDMRDAGRLGLQPVTSTVDFPAVMAAVHAAVVALEPPDSPAALEAAGVDVVTGAAGFTGPDTLTVDGEDVAFRRAVIATGAQPVVPDVPGLAPEVVLTSDTVWGLEALPDPLLVLGGGAVGCELAQALARLGTPGRPGGGRRPPAAGREPGGVRGSGRRARRRRGRRSAPAPPWSASPPGGTSSSPPCGPTGSPARWGRSGCWSRSAGVPTSAA